MVRNVKSNVNRNVKRARVLDLISKGFSPYSIAMQLGRTTTAIYRLIKRMQKDGLLTPKNELTDKGFANVKKFLAVSDDVLYNISNIIRLHNVQIVVNILEKPKGYDYRKNNIISLKVRDYQVTDLKNNWKEQFRVNDVAVKTNIDSIEIFPSEIYAETEQKAVKRLMDIIFYVIKKVENLHNITLIKEDYCNIRISQQHYALIKNQLARLYRSEEYKGSVFRVFDDVDGKVRLTIDISQTPEFEGEHPTKSPSDINKCQTLFRDIINKDFFLPSDTKQMIENLAVASKNLIESSSANMAVLNSIAYDIAYVAENYRSHVGMVQEGHKLFKKINSKLSQKKLFEFL